MASLSEKLATAKSKGRPHKDVPVCLDADLAEERDALVAELEAVAVERASDQRLGSPPDGRVAEIKDRLESLTDAAREAVVTLRFFRLPGRAWADLTSRHPVRIDSPIDRHYGYNFDAVCEAAAAYKDPVTGDSFGFYVEGDELVPLVVEPRTDASPNPKNEWAELFDQLAGSDVGDIRDAIWALNEYEPSQRLDALVKGFGAATRSDKK